MDANDFATIPVDYASYYNPACAYNYPRGEVMFAVRGPNFDCEKDPDIVAVCGLMELILEFEKRPAADFHSDRWELLGIFAGTRDPRSGFPQMQRARHRLGVIVLQGCTNVLPFWGREVRALSSLYIFFGEVRNTMRVFPIVHLSRDIFDALHHLRAGIERRGVFELLAIPHSKASLLKGGSAASAAGAPSSTRPTKYFLGRRGVEEIALVYGARLGRIRFSQPRRGTGDDVFTMDVPLYDLRFMHDKEPGPINMSLDVMKVEVQWVKGSGKWAFIKSPAFVQRGYILRPVRFEHIWEVFIKAFAVSGPGSPVTRKNIVSRDHKRRIMRMYPGIEDVEKAAILYGAYYFCGLHPQWKVSENDACVFSAVDTLLDNDLKDIIETMKINGAIIKR
jgi:hypothetical protein